MAQSSRTLPTAHLPTEQRELRAAHHVRETPLAALPLRLRAGPLARLRLRAALRLRRLRRALRLRLGREHLGPAGERRGDQEIVDRRGAPSPPLVPVVVEFRRVLNPLL